MGRPFDMAMGVVSHAVLQQLFRDAPRVQALAEQGIALTREHGYPFWMGLAMMLRGWALSQQGDVQRGLEETVRGQAVFDRIGVRLGRPYCLALLAEGYAQAGQHDKAFEALKEGMQVVSTTGDRFYEAELCRLQAHVLMNTGGPTGDIERLLRQAIRTARHQQARSFQLRAANSLAAFSRGRGTGDQAHEELEDA